MTTGGLWAVLPVKAWSEAKRRLSPVLSAEEREELARSMLDDLLAAIAGVPGITGTLAVTADAVAAKYLEGAGCEVLSESRRGLNRALGTASEELRRRGASTMLVLPIDLPLVTAADLEKLRVRHIEDRKSQGSQPATGAAVTVAPDRFRSGTNALVCSPPGCIPFRFGDGSFQAHLREAQRAGAAHSSIVLANLGLDVDHPDDLAELLRLDRSSRTGHLLRKLGLRGLGVPNRPESPRNRD
ncbi:MAG: 2-phospho-L-lactate guanylyltransferase [Acidobacteriota bacterium]|nr:2-phospho-L-lactate guanylyltransferase [Acidobacteriota bacterium]MDE2922195.1 2-phospho-L-lactate guanylyltransferase [Acidobacteriota bacterium]MDE3265304.1 2-phospho-L-lactate guanylyltransferase [Acidobacteriota bacterium]